GSGLPAQDSGVERLRRVEIVGQQLRPRVRARPVDDICTAVAVGLPEPDGCAGGVADDGHATEVQDVHGRHEDLTTSVGHLGGDGVGAVDVDVGGPERGAGRHLHGTHAGHDVAIEGDRAVVAGRFVTFGDVPSEQAAVEGGCGVEVGDADV